MTADQWRTSDKPAEMMLAAARRHATARKLRLVGCACCRRIWHLLPHDANRALVLAVEDSPAGNFADPDLNAAITASSRVEGENRDDQGYWAVKYLGRSYYKLDPLTCAVSVLVRAAGRVELDGGNRTDESVAQAELVRCILGDPFRPVPCDLNWRTETVLALATGIDADRAFDRLPILADALEEAGCDAAEVLTHLRGPGPHARGCWPVDAVLGRA